MTANRVRACETENRTQTFAAGHEAVLHRLEDDGRAVRFRWEDRRECGFDLREPFVEIRGELCGRHPLDSSSAVSVAGAGLSCPRSFRISIRRSASSRRA